MHFIYSKYTGFGMQAFYEGSGLDEKLISGCGKKYLKAVAKNLYIDSRL